MNDLQKQTITLAAICQAAHCVQSLSRTGEVDEQAFEVLLNSIINTSPENVLDVYGNDYGHIKQGLTVLIDHIGNQSKQKDPELTRYIVSLISLERRLTQRSKNMSLLGDRIDQSKRQLEHYPITSETLIASLASIYSDVISPLGSPIQVAGEPKILKQAHNQHKIRALLLAGIRAAVLWRQVGGKRRNILFGRTKLLDCAQQLQRLA
jgi:high frequency lysogenization protein